MNESLIDPKFELLKDDSEFSKLFFDEELETIVWPNVLPELQLILVMIVLHDLLLWFKFYE